STGRNFPELLRVIDSLQLTDKHKVATPVNWKQGEDVIIVPSLKDENEIQRLFPKGYKAIKWHRHEYEPVYHYDDPLCEAFLQEAYRLKLPIVLEESSANTRSFIRRVNGRTAIIIPHMGGLNGGFSALFKSGIWDNETVYADTALASGREIAQFLDRYGSRRILFGSDFPFGTPGGEIQEVKGMNLGKEDFENIVCNNILRLLNA
ncbi:MAG: amidohydrolase family protein, partial [Syntrophales bacterium]